MYKNLFPNLGVILFAALTCFVISIDIEAKEISIELAVEQLTEEEKTNVKQNLSVYQYKDSPFADTDYLDNLIAKGVTEIKSMLQTFGYYRSEVQVSSKKENDSLHIQYDIKLGPPIVIDSIFIQFWGGGEDDPEIQQWIANYPLKTGDSLSHLKYEQAKKGLLQLLRQRGYFTAKLATHKINVDVNDLSAIIVLYVNTGERHHFGKTNFEQTEYEIEYLQRFLTYSEGELFDAVVLAELQKRLLSSQEFLSVEINPSIQEASDLRVPINIRLTPRKKWRFSFGAGYATDIGPQVSASVTQKRFNKKAHQASANISLAEKEKLVQTNYRIPSAKPWSDYYSLGYKFEQEATEDTSRFTNSVSVQSFYIYDVFKNTVSIQYEDERYVVGDAQTERAQTFVPSLAIQYIPLEKLFFKKLKYDLYGEIKGAHEDFASNITFAQIVSRGHFKLDVVDRITLLSRYNIGFTDISDFKKLPVSYRFFTGGDYSVRGYKYNTLAPKDEQNNVVGGKNLLVGSVELQYRFLQNWDVATFYDIGNAYNASDTKLKQGAGIGIGWIYSFFSVRFYGASALSEADKPWRLHVLVGADI